MIAELLLIAVGSQQSAARETTDVNRRKKIATTRTIFIPFCLPAEAGQDRNTDCHRSDRGQQQRNRDQDREIAAQRGLPRRCPRPGESDNASTGMAALNASVIETPTRAISGAVAIGGHVPQEHASGRQPPSPSKKNVWPRQARTEPAHKRAEKREETRSRQLRSMVENGPRDKRPQVLRKGCSMRRPLALLRP